MGDKDIIIDGGMKDIDEVFSKHGITKEKIVSVESYGPDTFVAKRTRMELARRKNQRTPK